MFRQQFIVAYCNKLTITVLSFSHKMIKYITKLNHGGAEMSTNISKQKREELLAKINEIRTFIAAVPQNENTSNLLTCVFDLKMY